ncbi:MAG: hypothetical protein ACP5GZ_10255, partial [Vulcanisaeta sp.]|uniref:hypothetical protein n=1 Tax=Vulcanisaeta sp. TaxID=2020871 RepID=UPI003D0B2268
KQWGGTFTIYIDMKEIKRQMKTNQEFATKVLGKIYEILWRLHEESLRKDNIKRAKAIAEAMKYLKNEDGLNDLL